MISHSKKYGTLPSQFPDCLIQQFSDVIKDPGSEVTCPEETHDTPEIALSWRTQETKWLGLGRWLRRIAHLGQCAYQAPGHLSSSDLLLLLLLWRRQRAQNTSPPKSVPLRSTQEPEPEQLRPGKCTKLRAHFGQFPCRATWSLSSVDQESTPGKCQWAGANPLWSLHCKHSQHTPVIFVCNVPPSPQHDWTREPK